MKKGHHNIKSLLKYKNEKLVIELLENDVCVSVWEAYLAFCWKYAKIYSYFEKVRKSEVLKSCT